MRPVKRETGLVQLSLYHGHRGGHLAGPEELASAVGVSLFERSVKRDCEASG